MGSHSVLSGHVFAFGSHVMLNSPSHPQHRTSMQDPSYKFDAPDADVILRAPLQPGSKELKDFKVHKAILSVASTFFHEMFSVPQLPQPAKNNTTLPVVQIIEPAGAFEVFLRLIYPIEPPVINSLLLLNGLFGLAVKYTAGGVRAKLRQTLVSPSFLKSDPIAVYAIACRANLEEEAKLAISYTFEIDLIGEFPNSKLQTMTTEVYHRLLVGHSLRRDQLINAVDEVCGSRGRPLCRCILYFKMEMRIHISVKPFFDRDALVKCLPSQERNLACPGGCFLTPRGANLFLTDLLRRIREL